MCRRLSTLYICDDLLDLIEISIFRKSVFPVPKFFFNMGQIQMAKLGTLVEIVRTMVPGSKAT